MNSLLDNMRLIMSEEDFNRIEDYDEKISIDIHKMRKNQAIKFLRNIEVLDSMNKTLEIIHGYNNGTVLKEMLWNDEVFRKKHDTVEVINNPGRTIINFS